MRGKGLRGRSGEQSFRPVYSPAGADTELHSALEELRAGRWLAMRTLLSRTGGDWALRTARTQVLGVVAAGTPVVQTWLAEEPHNADARVMRARVAVERAARAHRERHPGAAELEREARHACLTAAERLPADPVPWICLLALARLDTGLVRPEHRERAGEPMLPPGPWGLLHRVRQRDPHNREAHHRMLHFLYARTAAPVGSHAPAVDFVRWVTSWAPAGSALLVLPLYAYVEQFRRRRGNGRDEPWLHRQWAYEPAALDSRNAFHGWFETDPGSWRHSVSDLHHLAHALWAGRRFAEAAEVFTALGPYYCPQPWVTVAEDTERDDAGKEEFLRARAQSLNV